MARILFEDFGDAVFCTEMVCAPALHPGAHTDNIQLLQLAAAGRARFFAALGYTESNVEGVRMFVGDQAVQYRAEAFPGQPVEVQMAVRDMAGKGFDLVYRLVARDSGVLIALGKIGMVSVDPVTRRPCDLPAVFRTRVQSLEPLAVTAV